VGAHVAGGTFLKQSLWGTHALGFFHPAWLWVASAIVILSSAGVVAGHNRFASARLRSVPRRRLRAIQALALTVGGAALWLLRSRNTYLGDGTVLVGSIADGQAFHPRQPLTMLLQQAIYRGTGELFGAGARDASQVAQDTIAFGSVVTGIVFIPIAWRLARELVHVREPCADNPERSDTLALLIALLLIMQGYIQLFFGYVENYAFYALGVIAYLWVALRFLRGRGPLLLPAAALVVGIAFHLAAALLLPSLIALFTWAFTKADLRRRAIRDLLVTCALFLAIRFALSQWQPNYDLAAALGEATGFAVKRQQEHVPLFSIAHLRDVVSEQLLIGPLGIVLLGVAVAVAFRAIRGAVGIFLVAAAIPHLAPAWLAGDSLPRDWDLFAPAGIVFTTAALGLFLRRRRERGVAPALVCALVLSVYHTVPWVLVNASPERGLARLKTLPLEFGQREVLVSQWYRAHGFEEERHAWLVTALAINPRNTNAHHLLGVYHSERGDWESAARSFYRAAQVRPDQVLFRQLLADALIRAGRDEEALPHLEFELSQTPGAPDRWTLYGETLREAGREQDAIAAFERALALYVERREKDPARYEVNLACGWLLHSLDRFEESLPYLEAALRARPDSDSAACLLGFALRSLGRLEPAATHFRRCLELNPDRPDRAEIETWLRDTR
jgi:tetratricopeptide (TPR) repeat protein